MRNCICDPCPNESLPTAAVCEWHLKHPSHTMAPTVKAQMQNKRGEWVPSIPLPFYQFMAVKCSCGKAFRSEERYREHYAYKHIVLGEEDL